MKKQGMNILHSLLFNGHLMGSEQLNDPLPSLHHQSKETLKRLHGRMHPVKTWNRTHTFQTDVCAF